MVIKTGTNQNCARSRKHETTRVSLFPIRYFITPAPGAGNHLHKYSAKNAFAYKNPLLTGVDAGCVDVFDVTANILGKPC